MANTPKDRVVLEEEELQIKIEALKNMLDKPKPDFISQVQWDLMQEQYVHMCSYGNILRQRIKLF